MKYFYILSFFVTFLISCEPLDLKRVMDTTTDDIEISGTSVIAHGTLLDVGETTIVDHGHCWSRSPGPTIDDSHTDLGEKIEAGEFSSKLFGLIPGQKHYIRSYIYDGTNYIYGGELSFEITAEDIQFNSIEIKELDAVGSILVSSSTDGIGSVNFSEHGHCWSQTDPPTINDVGISAFGEFKSDTSFTSQINNLTMGVYYIRGYLEAEGSVIYTNTLVYESKISVQTGIIQVYPNSSAVAEGEILSLGVKPILDHGHCWSYVTNNPNFNNQHNSLGTADNLGVFHSNIEGLNSDLTYYIRSYAFDGSNYYYGETRTFKANHK
ncbi:MAG: hypothetical protein HC831_13865 [Chloroflexia bacterium]|nr:hypothetical protein [Chloroflexia bacterium]